MIFVLLLPGSELQYFSCSDIGSFALCHGVGLEHPYPLFAVLTDVDIKDVLLLMQAGELPWKLSFVKKKQTLANAFFTLMFLASVITFCTALMV